MILLAISLDRRLQHTDNARKGGIEREPQDMTINAGFILSSSLTSSFSRSRVNGEEDKISRVAHKGFIISKKLSNNKSKVDDECLEAVD
jgi:hypothetical protein